MIAPDVGGETNEDRLLCRGGADPRDRWDLGRPVKWIEDRRENFSQPIWNATSIEMEIAVDADGKLLGVRGKMIHDTGAYMPWGIISLHIGDNTASRICCRHTN